MVQPEAALESRTKGPDSVLEQMRMLVKGVCRMETVVVGAYRSTEAVLTWMDQPETRMLELQCERGRRCSREISKGALRRELCREILVVKASWSCRG